VPEAFVRPTVTSGLETRLQDHQSRGVSRARLDAIITRFQLYDDLKKRVAARSHRAHAARTSSSSTAAWTGPASEAPSPSRSASGARIRSPSPGDQHAGVVLHRGEPEGPRAAGRRTAEFLKAQLAEIKIKLDTQEKQISQFKKRNLVELPQQPR